MENPDIPESIICESNNYYINHSLASNYQLPCLTEEQQVELACLVSQLENYLTFEPTNQRDIDDLVDGLQKFNRILVDAGYPNFIDNLISEKITSSDINTSVFAGLFDENQELAAGGGSINTDSNRSSDSLEFIGSEEFPLGTDNYRVGGGHADAGTDNFRVGGGHADAGTDNYRVGGGHADAGTDNYRVGEGHADAGTKNYRVGYSNLGARLADISFEDELKEAHDNGYLIGLKEGYNKGYAEAMAEAKKAFEQRLEGATRNIQPVAFRKVRLPNSKQQIAEDKKLRDARDVLRDRWARVKKSSFI
jgi:hypothetical protein